MGEGHPQEGIRDGAAGQGPVGSEQLKIGRRAIEAVGAHDVGGDAMPVPYERKVASYEQMAKRQVAAATQGMRDPREIRIVVGAIYANVNMIAKAAGAEPPAFEVLMDQAGEPFSATTAVPQPTP